MSSAATTTSTLAYRYTIHYVPKRRSAEHSAIESEIVDWTTTIVDHPDGSVECIATPVYAQCPPHLPVEVAHPSYEVIESTEVLDMDKILAQEDVCSITCEEITTTTTTAVSESVETDDDATASESDGEDFAHQPPQEDGEDGPCKEGSAKNKQDDQQQALDDEITSDGNITAREMQSGWPTLALDDLDANATVDWNSFTYQRSFGFGQAVGSVLLLRRLLGVKSG
jgi:hypothetical protein